LYRLMERHGLQRSPTAGWVVEREPAPAAETMIGSVTDDGLSVTPIEFAVGQPGGEAA